ncbi:TRAP transporter large permease [Thioclava sp. GXIMD4215]|uniref:TRAP transporter large permease n=1 Tax=Thioclava sp. GXIMD4215 TaxID=3131928 RepID=UPI00311B3FF3
MLSLAIFIVLLLLGLPVAFAMIAGAVAQILLAGNGVLLLSLPQQFFQGMENYGLLALPVFIFLGELLNASGAAARLYALASLLTRGLRGGLAQASLIANALLAAVLGSTAAQITLMSRLAVPQMERAGYPRDVATGLTAAGALLAPIIPPSMLLIVYGVIAQVPVGDLFLAGIAPGVLLAAVFALVIDRMARRGAFPTPQVAAAPAPSAARAGFREALLEALPAIVIPAGMIAAIMLGFATPVEAGVAAIALTLMVGAALYRTLTFGRIWQALLVSAKMSGAILFLIAAASLYAWIIAFENLPALVAHFLWTLSDNPLVFLLLVNLLLLGLGMICDPLPALILTVPVLLPVAVDHYHIDAIHFGLVACFNLTIGLMTPPVGVGLYTAALQNNLPTAALIRVLRPFLAAALAVLALLTLWPRFALAIPSFFQ